MTGTDLLVAPTNVAAEWSVLGTMLTQPDLISEVIGVPLSQEDFSQPETRLIFATAIERSYAGKSVDPLVIGELCRDELAQYWNADAGHVGALLERRAREGIVAGTVLEHSGIVKQLSTRRQLQEACYQTLVKIADGKLTPEEIGDQLSTEALQITSGTQRRSELLSWMDTGRDYVRQLQRVMKAKQQGVEIGVYTGLPFIDNYTTGIGPGELCFMAGEPGVGKALALDTPIATRGGWATMGDIAVGDTVFDRDGAPTRVVGVSAVQYGRDCYRVTFCDGQAIVADAEHLWVTSSRIDRQRGGHESSRTTAEIAATLHRGDGGFNHRIENAGPLDLPAWPLTVNPWVLGLWLGDGNAATGAITVGAEDRNEVKLLLHEAGYTTHDKETGDRADQIMPEGLGTQLVALGVLHRKRIPVEYLRASSMQREMVLAGLIDSDGWVREDGRVEISTMHEDLAGDVCELVASLGLKFTCKRSRAVLDGRFAGWRHRIAFMPYGALARLKRKQRGRPVRDLHAGRFIRSVVPVPSVPVRCIKVESSTQTYLAGRAMIPTHNTAVAWAAALGFAERQQRVTPPHGKQRVHTLVLSMEMNLYSSTMRVIQSLTGIDGVRLREGALTAADYANVLRTWKDRENLPMKFNFASNFRLSQMRALIAEGIRKFNVGFVVIDHFRMIDTDRRYTNPNQEDEAKVRFLKENIAKDLNVAVMCLAHTVKVGRGEGGTSPKPRLSDLRGSGMISAHADQIGFLWSPYKYMSDEAREQMFANPSDVELSWEKNRFGAPATAQLTFVAEKMRVLPR